MPDVFAESDVPGRFVMAWTDSISNIPSGWAIADGNNGTPNLLDKFVVSTQGKDKAAGATAGSHYRSLESRHLPRHTHTGKTASGGGRHNHLANYSRRDDKVESGNNAVNAGELGSSGETDSAGSHRHTVESVGESGSGSSIDMRPEYYEVVYIVPI